MKPSIIAFDFETTGLDYWSPDFRVLSCAFAWSGDDGRIKTRYLTGEEEVGVQLGIIHSAGIPLVAHNASFELGVVLFRYHYQNFGPIYDTMRLVQVYDNGGKDVKSTGPLSLEDELAALSGELKIKTGLGLESAVTRLLPKEFHDHKQPYYKWLRDNGVKKGQEGANLHLLPEDMLESYNTMDAILTLMLYNRITEEFAGKYDWTYDHKLHMAACERIVRAKARGIRVSTDQLRQDIGVVAAEIVSTQRSFVDKYSDQIKDIEAERWETWVNEPKTERGKQQRAAKPMPESLKFNPGSTKQLADLFIGKLGIKPTFFTKEGKASRKARETDPDRLPFVPQPSMRAAHLPSYGEGGQMLSSLKKRRLVLLQEEKLLELSAKDGRFHHDLKACGTKTGRYAGGGGLNVQGLARREKGLMGSIIPDEGNSFVSIDLAAGEPTVVAHYSQDRLYRAAAFDMVGKQPYLDGELLVIDDPYLMFASISPIGKDAVKRAIDEGMIDQWLTNAEHYKSSLKKTRAFHKTVFLAKMYGQGARGTVNFAADQGESLDFQTSKTLHHQFWYELFPNVRMLGERLEVQFKRQGFLVNEFGYRLVPERESLCLNYMIQSSVSGIIKLFDEFVLAEAPWATWVTVIHDEQIWEVPTERLAEFKECVHSATQKLNEFLGWTVEIRTGFQTGANLHEAK